MERQETPDPRRFHPAPEQEVREAARQRGTEWAAVASGVTEGVLEGLERYRLAQQAETAVEEAGELAQAVGGAMRHQSQDPVLRELGHDLGDTAEAAGQRTRQGARSAREDVVSTAEGVRDNIVQSARDAQEAVTDKADEIRDRARWTWMKVRSRSEEMGDDLRIRARAVAESGHRAKKAPRLVAADVKEALRARMSGMGKSAALKSAAGVVALTAFIVLTVATVAGLNALLGAPAGTFVAALLYAAVAVGLVAAAKKASKAAKERAAKEMEDARQQVRDVVRPLQVAFTKDLEDYR